jgi:ABC-2 family transporter protein
MSTTTVTAELPQVRRRPRLLPPLVSAELLKLRRRRGLVISTLVLTVVPMIVAYAILTILHAANSGKHGPAGGAVNFTDSLNFLGDLSLVAAILVGATLGTGDLGAGVFRELVVTGRSRLAIFAARVPAGLGLLLPFVAAAFAVTATAATVLAGSLEGPSNTLIAQSFGWLVLMASASLLLALGVSSLVGSRGTSIGILFGWSIVASPLLLQIGSLGFLREGILRAATQRFEPASILGEGPRVSTSLAVAAAVVLAWTILSLGLGAWRTSTRDA